ncbi:MAG: zf-HC2 domain-containing protein [Fimbriimonadaceae bacterium]|nr:zf-HC2 domain-containing protein [Fimbriimonadaceae bacterium]
MRCREVRLWMEEFACDGVDPGREAAFQAHLAACPECAADWQAVTAVDDLLAAYVAPEPPAALLNSTRAAIREAIATPPARAGWFGWLLRPAGVGVGACLLLGVFASGLWLRDRDLRETAAGRPAPTIAALPAEPELPAEPAPVAAPPPEADPVPPAAAPPRVAAARPATARPSTTRQVTGRPSPRPATSRARRASPVRMAAVRPAYRRTVPRPRVVAPPPARRAGEPAARLADSLVVVALAAPRVTSHSSSAFTLRAAGDDAAEPALAERDPRPETAAATAASPREEFGGSGLRVTAAVVESWPTEVAAGGAEAAR